MNLDWITRSYYRSKFASLLKIIRLLSKKLEFLIFKITLPLYTYNFINYSENLWFIFLNKNNIYVSRKRNF